MNDSLHRKDRLILTTIDIIDELGIQNLSTREIAKREGVSEATLFRHFKSKNDLLAAVLEYYSKFDDDIYQTTGLNNLKPAEAIRFFVNAYMEYYENYPAITSVMQLMDVFRREAELEGTICRIWGNRWSNMKSLIENAQKSGDINPAYDSECITDMINGFIYEVCLLWKISNREFSLKERSQKAVNILLIALKA